MMDFSLLLKIAAPLIVSLLSNTAGTLKTDNPPLPDVPLIAVPKAKASAAIADLQRLLNAVADPQPPLEVDGWLGPQTEAAIELGITKLKSFGIG
jgi:hypothetical protein